MSVYVGRYRPTTGRRWWLGLPVRKPGYRHRNALSVGIAGRGYYLAILRRTA